MIWLPLIASYSYCVIFCLKVKNLLKSFKRVSTAYHYNHENGGRYCCELVTVILICILRALRIEILDKT